jgi:hypothetical protein
MLTGSGVDEAWTTGVQLAEGVVNLLRAGSALHPKENSPMTYEEPPPCKLGGARSSEAGERAQRLS